MLPGGFKKDSRVWLHKNAHIPHQPLERVGSDDPYSQFHEDAIYNQQYLITDENGRVFKKDSRTWLHKSSAKKATITANSSALRLATPGGKLSWRQIRTNPELKLSGMTGEELFRTRSSTEMVRTQSGMNKLKKKKRTIGHPTEINFSPTLDYRSVKEIPLKCSSHNQYGASFSNTIVSNRGSCDVSAHPSDYCIIGKPSSRTLPTSNSASEIEDDDDDNADGILRRTSSVYEKRAITTDYPTGLLSDSGCTGSHRTTSLELSKDGLQELIKVEQCRRRLLHFTRHHDVGPGSMPPEVSPRSESSDSRFGLDATYSLSEEIVCGKMPSQAPNSAEQLSIEGSTHVRSSDLATPTDSQQIRGGVLRST